MLTFEQKMKAELVGRGMFPEQADTVIGIAKDSEILKSMKDISGNRWPHPIEDYPPAMVNIVWFSVKAIALDWIKENKPMAWFRPMFEQ